MRNGRLSDTLGPKTGLGSEHTRVRLLEAALDLLAERGYRGRRPRRSPGGRGGVSSPSSATSEQRRPFLGRPWPPLSPGGSWSTSRGRTPPWRRALGPSSRLTGVFWRPARPFCLGFWPSFCATPAWPRRARRGGFFRSWSGWWGFSRPSRRWASSGRTSPQRSWPWPSWGPSWPASSWKTPWGYGLVWNPRPTCVGIWREGMVQAEEITRSFGSLRVLDQVSLSVSPGEVFGLLGPNGAGKTTLVRILSGVLRPDGGKARVAGLDVLREPHRVKEWIGYATQEQSVYRDLTVEENLRFRSRLFRAKGAGALVEEALERFGLAPYAKTPAGHLSGGWRQRLALAQAVVHAPKVLPHHLGPPPPGGPAGGGGFGHHPLHGRGRALPSPRPPLPWTGPGHGLSPGAGGVPLCPPSSGGGPQGGWPWGRGGLCPPPVHPVWPGVPGEPFFGPLGLSGLRPPGGGGRGGVGWGGLRGGRPGFWRGATPFGRGPS